MDKKDLLKFCRYYKGERPLETHDAGTLISWRAERAWFFDMLNEEADGDILPAYIAAGLSDFRKDDDIPIYLKAYLFQSFCHYAERTEIAEFKKYYLEYYKY